MSTTFFVAFLVFGLIVFVHEFGHYIFAKITGIRVEEFSLGMGPKLIGKQWGETLYSLRILPIGGFCRMSGEGGEHENSLGDDPRRFDRKPVLHRFAVLVGGPAMNFLLAALIFIAIFSLLGVPDGYTTHIGHVFEDRPADAVGLQVGDRITGINNIAVDSWQDMVDIIHVNAGKELNLTVERDEKTLSVNITPILDDEGKYGVIGISPQTPNWKHIGLWAGIKEGLFRTYEFTRLTILGLVQMIRGEVSTNELAGPVGIVQMIDESARFGLVPLANLTALLSISLGFFNLLPIPALDGGRLIFIYLEIIRGKPVNPTKENFVHLIGFALLIMLMVFITYRDILKWLGKEFI